MSRIQPLTPAIDLSARRATLRLRSRVRDAARHVFTLDLYDEVRALLEAELFEIVHATGLHLELMLNWLSPQPKLDRLQRRWNRPWAIPLMRVLLAAGALAPRYSLDLVFVARKRA